jgi:hypothetical protein
MVRCEWCNREADEVTTIQIIKWKDELTHGIRRVCKECKIALKGEYRVIKFADNMNKYLLLVGKIRYIQKCIRERLYGDLDRISEDLSKAINDVDAMEREYINLITIRCQRGKDDGTH